MTNKRLVFMILTLNKRWKKVMHGVPRLIKILKIVVDYTIMRKMGQNEQNLQILEMFVLRV